MHEIDITADELISALLSLAKSEPVCILDSCGVGHLGSHLLIAGIEPIETLEITNTNADATLNILDQKLTGEFASIFTLSYDLGRKMLNSGHVDRTVSETVPTPQELDIFLTRFDTLIVHDYDNGTTKLVGNAAKYNVLAAKIKANISDLKFEIPNIHPATTSNFTKRGYVAAIENVKERIRRGDTYQTNLTQQLIATLPATSSPVTIFARLRRDHPAPFSAYITRRDSVVVSASPERFFSVDYHKGTITTSPIKGTGERGRSNIEDAVLRQQLLDSTKDRAENTMIVDLLRNDLGRVCEFGTVRVEKLCDLEEHPTLFHLVSTITGNLRPGVRPSDILKAVFPCGSITGAPKISTMQIIDEIEPVNRGLSMGAIGYYIPKTGFGMKESLDLSVAIRTMVIRGQTATFNVGGGIVIDSDPESEYAESLLKAKALLAAMGCSEFKL